MGWGHARDERNAGMHQGVELPNAPGLARVSWSVAAQITLGGELSVHLSIAKWEVRDGAEDGPATHTLEFMQRLLGDHISRVTICTDDGCGCRLD